MSNYQNPYSGFQQQPAPQSHYNQYGYSPYAPYTNPYQRLRDLEALNPQFGQTVPAQNQLQPQQSVSMQPIVRAIPVTSIDEAKTANVLDGSRYIFYNTSNDEIYSRQFDIQTGKADTITYERSTPMEFPAGQPQPVNEVQELRDRVNALESKIEGLERGVTNESQRNGTNDVTAEPAGAGNVPAAPANAKPGAKSKPTN